MIVTAPVALLTRPRSDSEAMAGQLAARGFRVVIEPLLDIAPVPGVVVETGDVSGILATSANGIRALASIDPSRHLPVWAVGEASARVARDLGYVRVAAAGGDVTHLAELVASRVDPREGVLLHPAGSVVAGDLAGLLATRGFQIRRIVLYQACPATAFSVAAATLLRDGGVACALFFSPRTAETFATLVQSAGLGTGLRTTVAYALSANVAARLRSLPWAAVRVAATPVLADLLAVLDQDLERGGSSVH